MEVDVKNKNGPPLPLLPCELSVPVRENLGRKKYAPYNENIKTASMFQPNRF